MKTLTLLLILLLNQNLLAYTNDPPPTELRPGSFEWTQWWVQNRRTGDGPYWGQVPAQRAEWDKTHHYDNSQSADYDMFQDVYVAHQFPKNEEGKWMPVILLLSGATSLVVGRRHGHRWWSSLLAGLMLGPIGVLLVRSRLTLQKPTHPVRILSARMVNPQQHRRPYWPMYTLKSEEVNYIDG